MQGYRLGCATPGVFVAECIGEDELGILSRFKGNLVNTAREEEEDVFGEEEIDELVLLFGAGVCFWWGV